MYDEYARKKCAEINSQASEKSTGAENWSGRKN